MSGIAEGFFVEPADPVADHEAIINLREQVFVHELGASREVVWDAHDPKASQVIARADAGPVIGGARMLSDGSIGRLAVDAGWRCRGVGGALLMRLVDLGRQRRLALLKVQAEPGVQPFYAHHGFVDSGESVVEGGVSRRLMHRSLASEPPLERQTAPAGAESPEIELDTLEACREALASLLADAQRNLYICTRSMDAELFCGESALRELRRVATSGRGAELRILVQDPEAALREGAPLLALAQRLPTSMPVRQTIEDSESPFAGAYVLNDRGGLLFRPIGSRFEGIFQRHAPGHHRQLLDQFQQTWDRSSPASSLRAQSL